nr:reverse transcriptase domain-containing protein [Tanacetum cinerariifolium]
MNSLLQTPTREVHLSEEARLDEERLRNGQVYMDWVDVQASEELVTTTKGIAVEDWQATVQGSLDSYNPPGDLPVHDLRTMKKLCQPSLNGQGGPIAPIAIQATNFGLKNDMIQQVHNSCQFHGLPGDDANKHLDKFLHVTQSIKVNGVTDDTLSLYLFPQSLTHHATAWFDHLPRNSIDTFE